MLEGNKTSLCVFYFLFHLQCGYIWAILGGSDVTIEQVPYQVNYGDVCGGVLIHKKWAVTTAHCGTHNFIRIGSRHRLRGPKVKVIYHLVHPNFGIKHTYDFDIQLLELRRPLFLHNQVMAIRISDGDCGDDILVAGWGYPKEKGDYNEILQQVRITIVPFERCQAVEKSMYNDTLTSRMFCAGDKERDACQGDSGGGAVSLGQLVGLSSFGYGCGRNIPGVYTNISHLSIRSWIREHTGV